MTAAAIPPPPPDSPSALRWILGFLLVGAAWGLTNPFIRRAAVHYTPPSRPWLLPDSNSRNTSPFPRWLLRPLYSAYDLLRTPAYAVPLLVNLTGSVWFFLLIGQAELSLMVPIVNSLAFMFTVLGDWLVARRDGAKGKEGTVTRETWIGMGFVVAGIALCVKSKQQ